MKKTFPSIEMPNNRFRVILTYHIFIVIIIRLKIKHIILKIIPDTNFKKDTCFMLIYSLFDNV